MYTGRALPGVTRDAILKRWVSQPPTTPIIQSLRDEERRRALARLKGRRVLDLASEANVTTGIESDAVTRVDFSPDASAHAREVLGDGIDYHAIDPENPELPFEKSEFDAAVVFAACAEKGTAVEINSRPERQDPPGELLTLAVETGCVFAISTDAHAPGQLDFLDYGCERAVRYDVPPERVVNTWPLERLLAWSQSPESIV